MIKTIISCADIHIRNYKRQEEYLIQIQKFLDECKNIVSKHDNPNEVRIVIAGDIFHSKLDISGEGYILGSWLLIELDKIAPTIIIAGNHDINMNNVNRLDPLTAIVTMVDLKQTIYLDKELNYQSGCYKDDNIIWCLYSSFNKFAQPNIDEFKINFNDDKYRYVGLFHGELKNAKTDTGKVFENGLPTSYFEGLDFGILGHIHKRQCIKNEGVPLVYCGSLIQQDHGESIYKHGYIIWNVENCSFEEKNIANEEYGFYTFAINSIEDIDNNLEKVINV